MTFNEIIILAGTTIIGIAIYQIYKLVKEDKPVIEDTPEAQHKAIYDKHKKIYNHFGK